MDDGFPLNTGQVTDQRAGMVGGIYSLHRTADSFVWDADGADESHRVLCRDPPVAPINGTSPSPSPPSGGEFVYVADVGSWAAGRAACQSRGGDLASIHSAAENALAFAVVPQSTSVWIGASDSAREGTWVWVDGTPFDYHNWHAGEPNQWGGNEDCVEVNSSGKWNDCNCAKRFKFVCDRRS